MNAERQPILASWKISEVLSAYPELLDVLIQLTPAFRKLRNPVLRRVQTRLVTVQQAAGIAGIAPAELVRTLNRAAGLTPPESAEVVERVAPQVAPAWLHRAPVVRELDVRSMLEKGQEPFRLITGTAREVSEGEVLRLVTGFEPLPLYDALAKQGFSHWAVPLNDAGRDGCPDWEVFFHRDAAAGERIDRHATDEWAETGTVNAEVTIDVSELVPPEPMMKILQALEELPDGSTLLVHHVRRPMHLYDRLDELGYTHATRELQPGRVEIIIRKAGTES